MTIEPRRLPWPFWIVLELLALVILLLLWPISRFVTGWLARVQRVASGTPILLVHGFGMARGSMLFVGWRLARAGRGPIVAVGYNWLRGIDRAADRVVSAATALARMTGVAQIEIVAHSLGGLVSRHARVRPGGESIGRIVTLGTPHRGAWVGHLPIGPMARPMRRDTFGPANAGDLAIAAKLDLLIPWRAATLDPPADCYVLGGSGHGCMLLSRRVVEIIRTG